MFGFVEQHFTPRKKKKKGLSHTPPPLFFFFFFFGLNCFLYLNICMPKANLGPWGWSSGAWGCSEDDTVTCQLSHAIPLWWWQWDKNSKSSHNTFLHSNCSVFWGYISGLPNGLKLCPPPPPIDDVMQGLWAIWSEKLGISWFVYSCVIFFLGRSGWRENTSFFFSRKTNPGNL